MVTDVEGLITSSKGEVQLTTSHAYNKNTKIINLSYPTAPSSNSLLPAIASLVIMVLLLITCVALLVLALAVTATKLNKLRAKKGHTDPSYCYNQTGGGVGKTEARIYDGVEEGTGSIQGQRGIYQELKLETMEERQYATLRGEGQQC